MVVLRAVGVWLVTMPAESVLTLCTSCRHSIWYPDGSDDLHIHLLFTDFSTAVKFMGDIDECMEVTHGPKAVTTIVASEMEGENVINLAVRRTDYEPSHSEPYSHISVCDRTHRRCVRFFNERVTPASSRPASPCWIFHLVLAWRV